MACTSVLAGIQKACNPSIGGISKVWIGNYEVVKPLLQESQNKYTTVGDIGTTWFEYEVREETSNYSIAGTAGAGGRLAFWTSTITVVLDSINHTASRQVEELMKSPLSVIVEDSNGQRWLFGDEREVKLDPASTVSTGTAYTDVNQYSLVFTNVCSHLPYEVTDDMKPESLG